MAALRDHAAVFYHADRIGCQNRLQAVRDEIKRKNEDMRMLIEKMFGEVSSVKTDRNLLAGLFMEVAKCLSQDATPKHLGNKGGGSEPRLVG